MAFLKIKWFGAIKFGVSPVYAVYYQRNLRMLAWQILAKTRNSPNSPYILARQNLLIYSTWTSDKKLYHGSRWLQIHLSLSNVLLAMKQFWEHFSLMSTRWAWNHAWHHHNDCFLCLIVLMAWFVSAMECSRFYEILDFVYNHILHKLCTYIFIKHITRQ